MSNRKAWLIGVVAVLFLAGALRGAWLTADPPTQHTVGVVWHDEGAWVHNARNLALLGVWRTDEWNPMFIAPVFTVLEAAAFKTFGVGTWQARTVPLASGLVAILALMWGLSAIADRRAALIGGLLLATSYTFVMWNRAALMESTMTMFIVIGWAAYARAGRRPLWGVVAGAAVVLAFFTKASAAFFVAAMVIELATSLFLTRSSASSPVPQFRQFPSSASAATALGLAAAGAAALAVFVIPNWTEFQFYNWQMTVTRKPEYTLDALQDRVSWLPLAHGVFTRMWFVLLAASMAAAGIVARWRWAAPAERLAVLWLLVGLAELLVHDSGNERRYVMFVPGLVALASMAMSRTITAAQTDAASGGVVTRVLVCGTVAVLAFLVIGSALRLVWLERVLAHDYSLTVRVSAVLAMMAVAVLWWRWPAWKGRLATYRLPRWAAVAVVALTCGTDITLYGQWAGQRSFLNYEASRTIGRLLPPGTLVHGKLANGLALENRIAPLFVGHGFGNYADRLEREDARYILTYTQPQLGYEGSVILDVLRHYPGQRVIAEFDVDETPGADRAALIDKFPDRPESRARNQ